MEQNFAQIEWIRRADGAANGLPQHHPALSATGYNLMDREPRVLVHVPAFIACLVQEVEFVTFAVSLILIQYHPTCQPGQP